jgi:hypothetical protein
MDQVLGLMVRERAQRRFEAFLSEKLALVVGSLSNSVSV